MFDKKVSIIVPKTDNTGNVHSEVLPEVSKRFAQRFGGCTLTEVSGVWFDDSGQSFEDKSTLVYSYFDSLALPEVSEVIESIAQYVKVSLAQSAVLYAIEDARGSSLV